jgi:hypothetical protein
MTSTEPTLTRLAVTGRRCPGRQPLRLSPCAITPSIIANDCATRYNTGTWPDDQYAQVKVTAVGGGSTTGLGPMVRCAAGAYTCYGLYICASGVANDICLFKRVAGAFTSLAVRTQTYAAGDTFRIEVQGSTLRIMYKAAAAVNFTQLGAIVTDTVVKSGNPGIAYSGAVTSTSADDWEAGSIGDAPAPLLIANKFVGSMAQRQTFRPRQIPQYNSDTSGIVNASIGQVAATVTAAGGTQAVAATAIVSAAITQVAATVTATGGTQAIAAAISTAVAQVAATVTASGGTQAIVTINNVAISQVAATVTAAGGTQAIATVNNVAIAQVAATVTANGGTQVIDTGSIVNAAVTQVAASVTASGGTQTVAATQLASISQSAGAVTASGGTQTIATVNNASITQVAANVTATGGTQSLTAMVDAAIAQQAANVTASGGTQAVSASSGANSASITQVAASVTATGGLQIVSLNSSPLPPVKSPSVVFLLDGRAAVRLSKTLYMPL